MNEETKNDWALVTCVNDIGTLEKRLAASPCIKSGELPWIACFNMKSAADALGCGIRSFSDCKWLIWAHQDVYLPDGWLEGFKKATIDAAKKIPNLAITGVYGVSSNNGAPIRAGKLLDRGKQLHEPQALPFIVDSLDELLIAIRMDSQLHFDQALGFDFYGTDIVLQASIRGKTAAVVEGYCEHWSGTPSEGPYSKVTIDRIRQSSQVFEQKWAHRLPISTPCFNINRVGDVSSFLSSLDSHD